MIQMNKEGNKEMEQYQVICQALNEKLQQVCREGKFSGQQSNTTTRSEEVIGCEFQIRDEHGHPHLIIDINEREDYIVCEYWVRDEAKSKTFTNFKRDTDVVLGNIMAIIDKEISAFRQY